MLAPRVRSAAGCTISRLLWCVPRFALMFFLCVMCRRFLVSLPVLLGSDSFGQVGCRRSSTYDMQAVRLVSDMLRIAASLGVSACQAPLLGRVRSRSV